MTEHRIAYRWANGEVEGFVGVGFSTKAARDNALQRIRDKAVSAGEDVEQTRIIRSPYNVTHEEMETIQADWRIDARR